VDVNDHLESEVFALVCYMVTSACNLPRENRLYGPYRLIDAASRLITILEKEGIKSARLDEIRQRIMAEKFTVMEEEATFIAFLEDLVLALIPLMKEENEEQKKIDQERG
jgi:hypothetical protein